MEYFLENVESSKKDILYRLLEYALYELSEHNFNEMNQEAIFEYKYFDAYFTSNNRDAFFIKEPETNKLLGFVMVNTYLQKSESGHSIAEFLIIPKYRRNKIGERVAENIFDMYKGNWEVSPSLNNDKAYKFWLNTISKYTNGNYKYIEGLFLFNNE